MSLAGAGERQVDATVGVCGAVPRPRAPGARCALGEHDASPRHLPWLSPQIPRAATAGRRGPEVACSYLSFVVTEGSDAKVDDEPPLDGADGMLLRLSNHACMYASDQRA